MQCSLHDTVQVLNVLVRNLNYWDSVATLAGEIRKPAKNIPKAFGWAVVMVFLTYLLPILVSVGVMGSSKVDDGYFADVGAQVRSSICPRNVLPCKGFT